MRIALKNTTIDKYFGFLTKLDNISKKRLIVKLTESIEGVGKAAGKTGSLLTIIVLLRKVLPRRSILATSA